MALRCSRDSPGTANADNRKTLLLSIYLLTYFEIVILTSKK
jgi:hypothetical protein